LLVTGDEAITTNNATQAAINRTNQRQGRNRDALNLHFEFATPVFYPGAH